MLRNRALTALQKTYDESYLSCSTAVYYEGQGDEIEALRHWQGALDQIYEHNATKATPAYALPTDTEKALQNAVKQLELQCKERIDLLEALRISRRSEPTAGSSERLTKAPAVSREPTPKNPGSIGEGTIPAVAYSELSRPSAPHRPSLPYRPSYEDAMAGSSGSGPPITLTPTSSNPSASGSYSPSLPARTFDTETRSISPERRTMRTTLRSGKSSERPSRSRKSAKPAAEGPSKAATLAWSSVGSRERLLRIPQSDSPSASSSPNSARTSMDHPRVSSSSQSQWDYHSRRLVNQCEPESLNTTPLASGRHSDEYPFPRPSVLSVSAASSALGSSSNHDHPSPERSSMRQERSLSSRPSRQAAALSARSAVTDPPSTDSGTADESGDVRVQRVPSNGLQRKPVAAKKVNPPTPPPRRSDQVRANGSRRRERSQLKHISRSSSSDDIASNSGVVAGKRRERISPAEGDLKEQSPERSSIEEDSESKAWKKKQAAILKNLPTGVEETAAKQILNDIIIQGDEVHWGDIAGLEIAKNALRETVVYPFLRPDLFMGLREPARGMLLFGPPGTGKTMLARAVATESKSTFFSISASSLTSKYLGESEKLVKALFSLARTLAPSIIFVDEIDSLLSQRSGSGEHEATRRIKTEFLIQWSDLQRAAAGRETTEKDKERGDANRVLVLAATNLPWAIDEAARRRFVRRQYIPLPESATRETQLRTLLGQQKHSLSGQDIARLVELTDGFSGSDITSLAKDAAMGPLRSLGDALLQMTMDEIRPITLGDFEASLGTIRPSVSKTGLREYEDWAQQFGERGG